MTIQLYDTLSRRKRELEPRRPGELAIYVCGVTPYAYTHMGHARVSVLWDVFRRYLTYRGFTVKFVQNFTDVDDKIIARAQKEGLPTWKLAQRYIDDYHEVMAKLQVAPADIHPRVTTEIETIIAFVQGLVDKGHAYPAGGDVFYRVESFAGYGKLSGRSLEEMEAGSRIEVNPLKENPMDFALWKGAKEGEPAWESPWGPGRPGWHIECSAMSTKYLGQPFDIHGGGRDLIFPHHENEIAQSEAAGGVPLARYWMHNGFLNINQEKMSKSLGNFFTIREILGEFDAVALRHYFLSSQYRSPMDFSKDGLMEAARATDRIYETLERLDQALGESKAEPEPTLIESFRREMDDDFNTPRALALIFDEVRALNRLLDEKKSKGLEKRRAALVVMCDTLGLMQPGYFERKKARFLARSQMTAQQIDGMIGQRDQARRLKNWQEADRIRDELFQQDILLEDTVKGTVWKVK